MKNWRNVTVDGQPYRFRIGHTFVVMRDSDGKGRYALANEVKGNTPNDFERGQHKRTSDGMIGPSDVARWIRSNWR